MLGIFSLTREAESRGNEKQNENIDEPCYGGFSSRLDYEYCKNKRLRASTAFLCFTVFLFVGMTLVGFGIVAYDFMQQNSQLYFPEMQISDTPVERVGLSRLARSADDVTLVSVSSEQSSRYRIPRGVMVKMIRAEAKGYDVFAAGDIIVAVNGSEIGSVEELEAMYSDSESLTFKVFRQNQYIDIVVNEVE